VEIISSSKQSINRRLTRTVFLVTVTTLVIACLVFLAFDWFAVRSSITRNTETLAEVVGINSAVALTFYDPVTASETLGALSAVEQVQAAVIYDREGKPFASYVSDTAGARFTPPPVRSVGHDFEIGRFELARAIVFNGEAIGTIFILRNTVELTQRIQRYVAVVGMLLLAVAGVTWGIYSRLRRQVAAPLTDLAEASAAIADGDLSTEVPVRTEDEIGILARSFNAMTDRLGDIVGQVLQSIRDVGEVSQSLQRSSEKMAAEAQRQSSAIDETAESIEQLSASIVEVDTNVAQVSDSARETTSSIMEMDASIISVAENMDHLSESIEATSAGVIQVASGTDQVVSGVGTLKAATDGSMERLQELRRSVNQVREDASESHTLCDDTSQEASKGMEAVNETITAINEISTSFGDLEQSVSRLANNSKSIGEILQVIRDVAEQTSMLSLNAAIIAAQAGEHGKAFSVVADEVNNLAGRTHRSTQEIAKLVQAVQDDTAGAVAAAEEGAAKVDKGVKRSNVAGKVLAKISEKSKTSTEMVHAIFEASTHQNRDLERVEQAMTEVNEIVAQINRSTLDQQKATGEIADAVENIRSLGKGVKASTDEQRRGSRLMTDSVTHVATMIDQIAEATQAQTKSSETIQHALQVFQDVTAESNSRAEELGTMVGTLSERSNRLEEVVARFKTD
jgi:X-X-X-Leu-X-X-Gly heptad repeat protein